MHILTDTTGSQNLFIIPRIDSYDVSMIITEEESGTSIEYLPVEYFPTASMLTTGYQMLTDNFDLIDGKFYRFEVKNLEDNTLLYRGSIYCTSYDGEFENYRMNTYTTGSNDTIILI